MADRNWCAKCASKIGLDSGEFGSIVFKGKCSEVKANTEFKLCGRCLKRIFKLFKDRNHPIVKRKPQSIIVHPTETNKTEPNKKFSVIR